MSSQAISKAGMSLKQLLLGEKEDNFSVTFLAPDEPGGEPRVNLFLYRVEKNASLQNMDWQVKRETPDRIVPPPLCLNLFYLVTVFAKSEEEGNSRAHQILGEVMRIFHENSIVPQQYLDDELKNADERIKISLHKLDMEELSKIWSTFTKPYRLSVLYEVSVVQIAMRSKYEKTMARRVEKVGVPSIKVPYDPPAIESISPQSGASGTDVTFNGSNLAGWRAQVTVSGQMITAENGDPIPGKFRVRIPEGLQPGFHEVKVDISGLYRETFFFEVTK